MLARSLMPWSGAEIAGVKLVGGMDDRGGMSSAGHTTRARPRGASGGGTAEGRVCPGADA